MHPYSKPQVATASLSRSASGIQSSSPPAPAIVQLISPPKKLTQVSTGVSSAATSSNSNLSVSSNSSQLQGLSSNSTTSQASSTTVSQQSSNASASNLQKTINNTAKTVGQDLENLLTNLQTVNLKTAN
jgi:hypothetical protein